MAIGISVHQNSEKDGSAGLREVFRDVLSNASFNVIQIDCLCSLEKLELPDIVILHPIRGSSDQENECWKKCKEIVEQFRQTIFIIFDIGGGGVRDRDTVIGYHENVIYFRLENSSINGAIGANRGDEATLIKRLLEIAAEQNASQN